MNDTPANTTAPLVNIDAQSAGGANWIDNMAVARNNIAWLAGAAVSRAVNFFGKGQASAASQLPGQTALACDTAPAVPQIFSLQEGMSADAARKFPSIQLHIPPLKGGWETYMSAENTEQHLLYKDWTGAQAWLD